MLNVRPFFRARKLRRTRGRSPQAAHTPCRQVWVEVNFVKMRFIEKRQEKTLEILLK